MIGKAVFSGVAVLAVGLMVWDQKRLGQMTRNKWFIAAMLLLGLLANTWL